MKIKEIDNKEIGEKIDKNQVETYIENYMNAIGWEDVDDDMIKTRNRIKAVYVKQIENNFELYHKVKDIKNSMEKFVELRKVNNIFELYEYSINRVNVGMEKVGLAINGRK